MWAGLRWDAPALSNIRPPAAPEAPHISSVDYAHGVLSVRWTYGELFIDLSHSRMLHWQVVAVGRRGPERSYSVDVSPPGGRGGGALQGRHRHRK